MLRRAHLTVLEHGASATAWTSCPHLGADDWIVILQQRDEGPPEFTRRVRKRAQRLRKEGVWLESVDVFASAQPDLQGTSARRDVIAELGRQMTEGGQLTLWSGSDDSRGNAELSAILAQFGPLLAARRIAMNHRQAREADERSGVRHTTPIPFPSNLELDELA